jgi:hypothetical protein
MPWVEAERFDTVQMIRHASHRGLVRLRNGRIATLVSWPGVGSRGRTARMATRMGTMFRVHVREVESVEVEP